MGVSHHAWPSPALSLFLIDLDFCYSPHLAMGDTFNIKLLFSPQTYLLPLRKCSTLCDEQTCKLKYCTKMKTWDWCTVVKKDIFVLRQGDIPGLV
jgi:hypothetical protein